jgi:hypothetical protein
MSSTARLTLYNACLANLPMFQMGFYLLWEGVHRELDEVIGTYILLGRLFSGFQIPHDEMGACLQA